MKILQQKMKNIEEQRLKIRRDIEKQNEKLESLTRPGLSFEEHLQASQSCTEESLSNFNAKTKLGDSIATPFSQMPNFMRPTVCSRRRSGMDRTSERKDQVLGRRRMPSHRAESITFPMKNNSEYNSDRSISRSSCLAGLNLKRSVDNETEYSRETLDYEGKSFVSSKQSTSGRKLINQKAPLIFHEKTGNQKTGKVNITKFSKVEDWLSHKNEPATRGNTHRSKRVLSVPIPKKKIKGAGQSEKLKGDEVPAYDFRKDDIIKPSTAEQQFDTEKVGVPVPVEVNEKPQMMLKELFEQDSTFNSTSPSPESGRRKITEIQESIDSWSTGEDSSGTLSASDMCCSRLDQNEVDDADGYEDDISIMSLEVKGELNCTEKLVEIGSISGSHDGLDQHEDEEDFYTIEPEVKGDTQSSKGNVNKSGCSFSECDLVKNVPSEREDSGISISRTEMESLCQQVPTEKCIEDNGKENLDFCEPSAAVTSYGLLEQTPKHALLVENLNNKDLNIPHIRMRGRTQNEGETLILYPTKYLVSQIMNTKSYSTNSKESGT